MKTDFDRLIGPIGSLVTCSGVAPVVGSALNKLETIKGGAVGITGDRIAFVGRWSDVKDASAETRVEVPSGTVTPGFVDPHTHIPFIGDRADEVVMRLRGSSYMEIGRAGGGIISTMRAVRAASFDGLYASARFHANRFLANGVTTFEGKSGYGLEKEAEIKQLKVLGAILKEGPQLVARTFLGAHFVPPEFKDDPDGYVDFVIEEMLPLVANENLADFCDVFCEDGAFTPRQSRRILTTAKSLGLKVKLHADEIVDTGGGALAADVGAVSADHLMAVSDDGIEAMAKAGVCATLLPGTSFYLRKGYAPWRKFVEAGCPVALSTDCNPGSSYTTDLLQMATLAIFGAGAMVEEALWAVTLNAAYALRLHDEVGSIEVGKRADLCVWDVPSYLHLFYPYSEHRPSAVFCGGVPALKAG